MNGVPNERSRREAARSYHDRQMTVTSALAQSALDNAARQAAAERFTFHKRQRDLWQRYVVAWDARELARQRGALR